MSTFTDSYEVLCNSSIGRSAFIKKSDNTVFFIESKDVKNSFTPKFVFTSLEECQEYAQMWIKGANFSYSTFSSFRKARLYKSNKQNTEKAIVESIEDLFNT